MPKQLEMMSEPGERLEAPGRAGVSRRRWLVLACLILVVGLVASLGSALLWRSSVNTHDRQQFETSSPDGNKTLETLLRRDADFVTTLRAVLTMQPHMSASRFDQWFSQ